MSKKNGSDTIYSIAGGIRGFILFLICLKVRIITGVWTHFIAAAEHFSHCNMETPSGTFRLNKSFLHCTKLNKTDFHSELTWNQLWN